MHTENLLVYNCRDRQAIEAVGEGFPQLDSEPSLALIIEAINSVDLAGLVIAAEQEEVLWVLDLVAEEEANRLDWLFTAVDVVTKEEIVCFRWEASIFEDSKEIVILSVHVAYQNKIISSPKSNFHLIIFVYQKAIFMNISQQLFDYKTTFVN